MKKSIKKLWIDALTSGAYTQGEGALRSARNEYCCLGVLCDLHAKLHNAPENWFRASEYHPYTYNGINGTLPRGVRNWAGLDNEDMLMLIAHNDCHPSCPFPEIAELITNYL
jgi:hypothetical protein